MGWLCESYACNTHFTSFAEHLNLVRYVDATAPFFIVCINACKASSGSKHSLARLLLHHGLKQLTVVRNLMAGSIHPQERQVTLCLEGSTLLPFHGIRCERLCSEGSGA